MTQDEPTAKTPSGQDAKGEPERTRIKICGVRDVDTALHAARCGADMVGLVFVERSPRCVSNNDAIAISNALCEHAPGVERVGLFCDHAPLEVQEITEACALTAVQLHGNETPEDVAALQGLRVFKAVPFDVERIDVWRDGPNNVAALFIDTPHRPGEMTGGSGRAFDWSALAALDRRGLPPLVLAGGLTPENVGEAMRVVHPWGVDVSSGVESSRGVKDLEKISLFCAAVRAADAELRA